MALFDLDTLLKPLEGPSPCGSDLRAQSGGEGGYYHLKDLRAGARATERQADSDDEAQAPLKEWQQIMDSGTSLLANRAKDVEVAVWLVEAAVRLHGFSGLADGFRLLTGLVERFWDDVHPLPDEDGVGVRITAIAGLNGIGAEGTLIQPIRKVPLVRNDGAFAFWHFQLAQRAVQTPDTRNRPNRKPPPTPDALRQRMAAVPVAEKRRLLTDIRTCRTAFAELDRALTERCGTEAPPTSAIANLLEEIEYATLFLTELNDVPLPDPVAAAADDPILETSVSGAPIQVSLPKTNPAVGPEGIASREEALRLLADIGRFFRRTEPHSPISYTIEDLVRRGQMTLPELLAELVADPAVRNSMLTAAGIRVPPPS